MLWTLLFLIVAYGALTTKGRQVNRNPPPPVGSIKPPPPPSPPPRSN